MKESQKENEVEGDGIGTIDARDMYIKGQMINQNYGERYRS